MCIWGIKLNQIICINIILKMVDSVIKEDQMVCKILNDNLVVRKCFFDHLVVRGLEKVGNPCTRPWLLDQLQLLKLKCIRR